MDDFTMVGIRPAEQRPPVRRARRQRPWLTLVVLGLLAFSVMFVCRKGLNAAKARLSQGRRPLRRRKREDGGQ